MDTIGFTKMFVLDENLNLRNSIKQSISVFIVVVFFILLIGALTLLCTLLAFDLNQLRKNSLGVIKFDQIFNFVDFSQYEKDLCSHLTNSINVFEKQMNITVPFDLKQKF